jgi:hypothetical protein
MFYQVLGLAHAGDSDRGLEMLGEVVERGYYPSQTCASHRWICGRRPRPDFQSILQKAEHRRHLAFTSFVDAGGRVLLGSGAESMASER